MIRRVLLAALIVVSGCVPDSGRTPVRVWDWLSPVEGEKMREFFRVLQETFEREHPDIDLRYQHIPFGPQYMQKTVSYTHLRAHET